MYKIGQTYTGKINMREGNTGYVWLEFAILIVCLQTNLITDILTP